MPDKSINLKMEMEKDGDFWIGVAKEIPVSDFGRTQAEAFHRTHDAIVAWLHAYAEAGRLEEIAALYGFKIEDATPDEENDRNPPPAVFSQRYLVPA